MTTFLAIDPSFSGCGMAFMDDEKKTIRFGINRVESGFKKDFNGVFHSCLTAVQSVVKFIEDPPDLVIMEVPPPSGIMAPALYGLDVLLASYLSKLGVKQIYTIPPNFLSHLQGKMKNSQTDHLNLGLAMLSVFKKDYEVSMRTSRLSADEAVAFILLCRIFVRLNPLVSYSMKLREITYNIASEKEQLLYDSSLGG